MKVDRERREDMNKYFHSSFIGELLLTYVGLVFFFFFFAQLQLHSDPTLPFLTH